MMRRHRRRYGNARAAGIISFARISILRRRSDRVRDLRLCVDRRAPARVDRAPVEPAAVLSRLVPAALSSYAVLYRLAASSCWQAETWPGRCARHAKAYPQAGCPPSAVRKLAEVQPRASIARRSTDIAERRLVRSRPQLSDRRAARSAVARRPRGALAPRTASVTYEPSTATQRMARHLKWKTYCFPRSVMAANRPATADLPQALSRIAGPGAVEIARYASR